MTNKLKQKKTAFVYNESHAEYTIRLKKKKKALWWLLLLLLLLPLFVKCNKDVTVQVMDEAGRPCTEADVTLDYTSHFLYDNKALFVNKDHSITQQTDSNGITVFKNLRYSVYSCVFYFLSKAEISVVSECVQLEENVKPLFHFIGGEKAVVIEMQTQLIDVSLKIVDDEINTPIDDATVYYEYTHNGTVFKDSLKSNANGDVTICNVPKCHYFDLIRTTKEGYQTDIRELAKVLDLLAEEKYRTIRLKPIKDKIDFYVKNKFTLQPIPGATATITLEDRRTGKSVTKKSSTNVDGLGRGFYEDAFILATVHIKASKRNFKDGELPTAYTVKQFKILSQEERTIYLEPEPYTVEFQNVDSITRMPIVGVENTIIVHGTDGTVDRYKEISNRNGYFTVKAREGEKVEITSTLSPQYKTKETIIEKFEKEEIILMSPDIISLNFRTIEGYSSAILPDCTLKVYVDGNYNSDITNSGTGEFSVPNLYFNQQISIIASKSSYMTNDIKVRNASVAYLAKAPQSARDIPLDFPPCESAVRNGGVEGFLKEYDMGRPSGSFLFEYNTFTVPDHITIYDGKGTTNGVIFDYKGGSISKETERVYFNNRIITIKVTSEDNDTGWDFYINCPD